MEEDMTKLEKLEHHIRLVSAQKCYSDNDDFYPDVCEGGNIDDSYYNGVDDGRIQFARELLQYFE